MNIPYDKLINKLVEYEQLFIKCLQFLKEKELVSYLTINKLWNKRISNPITWKRILFCFHSKIELNFSEKNREWVRNVHLALRNLKEEDHIFGKLPTLFDYFPKVEFLRIFVSSETVSKIWKALYNNINNKDNSSCLKYFRIYGSSLHSDLQEEPLILHSIGTKWICLQTLVLDNILINSLEGIESLVPQLKKFRFQGVVQDKNLLPITKLIHLQELEISDLNNSTQSFPNSLWQATIEEGTIPPNYPIHLFPGYLLVELKELTLKGLSTFLLPCFSSFFNKENTHKNMKLDSLFLKCETTNFPFVCLQDKNFESITDFGIQFDKRSTYSQKQFKDVSFVNYFSKLESLEIDPADFPNDQPVLEIIAQKHASSLSSLYLRSLQNITISSLQKYRNLTSLRIRSTKFKQIKQEEVEEILSLKSLKRLSLCLVFQKDITILSSFNKRKFPFRIYIYLSHKLNEEQKKLIEGIKNRNDKDNFFVQNLCDFHF